MSRTEDRGTSRDIGDESGSEMEMGTGSELEMPGEIQLNEGACLIPDFAALRVLGRVCLFRAELNVECRWADCHGSRFE